VPVCALWVLAGSYRACVNISARVVPVYEYLPARVVIPRVCEYLRVCVLLRERVENPGRGIIPRACVDTTQTQTGERTTYRACGEIQACVCAGVCTPCVNGRLVQQNQRVSRDFVVAQSRSGYYPPGTCACTCVGPIPPEDTLLNTTRNVVPGSNAV
jgi:hypothetical protein